jgi:hypothetical protein
LKHHFSRNDEDILHLTYTNHRGEIKTFKLDATQVKVRSLLKKKLQTLREQVAQGRMNRDEYGKRQPQTVIGYLSEIAIGQKVEEEGK